MSSTPAILVTGDIVTDIHLYVAPPNGSGPLAARGTLLSERLGGAALTLDLLRAAATASGRDPATVQLGVEATGPAGSATPAHLRSYGVWTPHAAAPKSKDVVWRVSADGGYGPGNGAAPPCKPIPQEAPAGTLVIDEGGLSFRHGAARALWPDLTQASHVILKHSDPLCRGDLWAELLDRCADQLTVLLAADDLRREEALISRRLSWEQTAIDTLRALDSHPLLRELKRAATLVINFRAAGALCLRRRVDGPTDCFLVFRAAMMEGEATNPQYGSVYGFQSCLLAALAHHLAPLGAATAAAGNVPAGDDKAELAALLQGVESGLAAQRRLYELGHGQVNRGEPGFPVEEIGKAITKGASGLVRVNVPLEVVRHERQVNGWSILDRQEPAPEGSHAPMAGLAKLVARYGRRAVDDVPSLAIDPLFTVDRGEIESLRALKRSIEDYESEKVQKKPLSIAVFGPPGAGKSFAVKAIAKEALPGGELLEFNLSQFNGPPDLIGAFHQVRDAVLSGRTPVVFWDEFDSGEYKWLQYLLAPMQDGAFQEDRITHPIGKCVFVFAGGTSPTLERFGPAPLPAGDVDVGAIGLEQLQALRNEHARFRLLKGPDFVSRLHGYLNILGPNPRRPEAAEPQEADRTYPVRRALILRALMRAGQDEVLCLDAGLLHALLTLPEYRHGARSFEKIVMALRTPGTARLSRSALPALPVLERDVNAHELLRLMTERDAFKTGIDIERLAAAIHENYRNQAKLNGWPVQARMDCEYAALDADAKPANRSAALRMPDLLELIDFRVEPAADPTHLDWQAPLRQAIESHVDRLAKAEHLAWMDERLGNGWRAGTPRDDANRVHPSLVDWNQLTQSDHEKDRANVRVIPDVLALAGFRAVAG